MKHSILTFIFCSVILLLPDVSSGSSDSPLPTTSSQAEAQSLILDSAEVSGVQLNEGEISALYSLLKEPTEIGEPRIQALRTQAIVKGLLSDIKSSPFSAKNLTREEEMGLYQKVISILVEQGERVQSSGQPAYWWPLIFLNYSMPMTVGDETRVVEQNLILLEDADAFSSDDESKLDRLVSYHKEEKTPTYGYAQVARAVGSMTLLSEVQLERLMNTLDNNSGGMASKALKKLGLSRESFAEMTMSQRALFVVDIISFIPVLNIKTQILIFLGTFTYKRINDILRVTGADKLLQGLSQSYIERYGLNNFQKNYPMLHSLGQMAQSAMSAASQAGRGTVRLAQATAHGILNTKLPEQISSGAQSLRAACSGLLSRKPIGPEIIESKEIDN